MSYIVFEEDSGKILSVGNQISTDKLYIEVEMKIAEKFILGLEQFANWRVLPDHKDAKKFKLEKIQKTTSENFVNKSIFPLKKFSSIQQTLNTFQIIQNKNTWQGYAILDKDTKEFYMSRDGYFGSEKVIYVTDKNDKRKFLGKFNVGFEDFFRDTKFNIEYDYAGECDLYVATGNDNFIHVRQQ